MYDILLTINGNSLAMNRENGIDISTISGLTGTSAKLNTAQSNLYLGEDYTNGTVSGIVMNIKGVILDGDTAKKQALLDTVMPLGEGTLTVYKKPSVGSRPAAYRTIDVVVRETPTITQEKHSKFSFTLYAPKPIWKAPTGTGITISGTGQQSQEVTIAGQTAADYELIISVVSGSLKDYTLYFGEGATPVTGKYMYLNFRKYNADGVSSGTAIKLSRVKGKLLLTIGGAKHNECIYAQSTLEAIDIGTHTFLSSTDASTITAIRYYPSYVGVLVDGV